MSPLANRASPALTLGLLGNPENRRVQQFSQAVVGCGLRTPVCLSYRELLRDPTALDRLDVDLLRVESAGENAEVAQALIALGGGSAGVEVGFGEIAYTREYHRGFCLLMKQVEQRGTPCLNHPAEIAIMFDKWACHELFVRHGVNRPPSELAPLDFATMREQMAARGHGRLFLKPLHGSSGSGVCALRWKPGQARLSAPLRVEYGRLINCLRVRTYECWKDIETILTLLLPQGMIAERWLPKLALDDGVVDLRVLVIGGRARHRVVRQSRGPITNLHLGNRRGQEGALRQALGDDLWEEALRLAERAAACFPRCLYAGVDILLDVRGRAWVGEINAFGDLLPGLVHEGESAYQAIARNCSPRGEVAA